MLLEETSQRLKGWKSGLQGAYAEEVCKALKGRQFPCRRAVNLAQSWLHPAESHEGRRLQSQALLLPQQTLRPRDSELGYLQLHLCIQTHSRPA